MSNTILIIITSLSVIIAAIMINRCKTMAAIIDKQRRIINNQDDIIDEMNALPKAPTQPGEAI